MRMVGFGVHSGTDAKPNAMLQDTHGGGFCFRLTFRHCLNLHLDSFNVCEKSIKVGVHDKSSLYASKDIQSALLFV
jgi:hypothetical protein